MLQNILSRRNFRTRWHLILGLFLILVLGATLAGCSGKTPVSANGGAAVTTQSPKAEEPQGTPADTSKGDDLVIPVSKISKKATFYPLEIDGTKLEVLAVKAPDGSIRTAFNTCQVCFDSGKGYYKQEGDTLVCQNCGNRFTMDRVEVEAGGCNPWPIFDESKTVTNDSITIPYGYLKEATAIFQNWKIEY
jgi:uncharacterized membrane protein